MLSHLLALEGIDLSSGGNTGRVTIGTPLTPRRAKGRA